MNTIAEDRRLKKKEKSHLLRIARNAVEAVVCGEKPPSIDLDNLPDQLKEKGASFVTLTIGDYLRGCIGTIDAFQPLALDVQEHAVGAATSDYRFPKVTENELPLITIEISYLTPKQRIEYQDHTDLLAKIVPGKDGIILKSGLQRATFLPQVWEKLPDPCDFFSHLSMKMGAFPDDWMTKHFEVYRYQVEKFSEVDFQGELSK